MKDAICPACLDISAEELRRFAAGESAQHFVLREADSARHEKLSAHLRSLWGGDQCSIMICSNCGFGFCRPFVAGDAEFYELAYPTVGYTANRWEFDRTLRELARIEIAGARALEVGAGFGMFLDKLPSIGIPKSHITALEFHSASRAMLSEKGYNVESLDVRSPDFVASVPVRSDFHVPGRRAYGPAR